MVTGISSLTKSDDHFEYFCFMINRIRLLVALMGFLCMFSFAPIAQEAYQISVNIKPFNKGYLYLAHHYGNKQFLIDSARIEANGDALFTGKEKLMGGVYMIAYPEKNGWIECLLDKEQRFSLSADTSNIIGTIQFNGSPDNELFAQYQKKSFQLGSEISNLQKLMAQASPDEAEKLRAKLQDKGGQVQQYREQIMREHPDHLLTAIFHVLKEPVVPPASAHPNGRYDSMYAYQYYKSHYWDNISMTDERLIRTPVFEGKFNRYYDQVLPQHPDSLIRAAGDLIDASRTNPEMFKYLLSNLTDKYVNPTYMGQDAVFVYLFEKYYLTGQADSWMNEKYKKFIFDRGYSLMANVLGKKGSNFDFVDTLGKKSSLYTVNAPYTVICFWDPTCGHCKDEVPRVDSIFQLKWKKQGVALVGMMTDGGKDAWLKFIREKNLKGWMHVHQTQEMKDADQAANRPGFRQLYDVYQTPLLYLLDKEKRIIAKKLTYTQLDELLQQKMKTAAR